MRISDWSSDVCSSDLIPDEPGLVVQPRLVDVHVVSQQEARDPGQPVVGSEARHRPALQVDLEDRPHFPAARLGDHRLVLKRGRIGKQLCRSEEHTSELQSLMRISYAVFCLTKQKRTFT